MSNIEANIDTNIKNYTLSELMAISEVNDLDPNEITKKTNELITRFKNRPTLSVFFREIQSQLLQYSQGLIDPEEDTEGKIVVETFTNMSSNEAKFPVGARQTNNWLDNQVLKQSDSQQNDKITERKQKIDVYGNQHVPMNREQLGINNNFNVPVAQDSLNPNLKNTITRFINLDSQFRQSTNGAESASTDYSLDLSDPLNNVLSLSVYSYQIPAGWYVIDIPYGNTCFWISDPSNIQFIPVSIPPGNYSPDSFVIAFNLALTASHFSGGPAGASYNANNGKITISVDGKIFAGGTINNIAYTSFTITPSSLLLFYDFEAKYQCNIGCNGNNQNSNYYLNQTLGWIMGFRVPYINVDTNGNTPPAIMDLNGTKYLILVIDDFNQNHVNNGLVSISEYNNVLKLPSYFSPDLPYICIPPSNTTSNMQSLINSEGANTGNGLLLASKVNVEYTSTQQLVPSAPRTLTSAQLYTINEINKNRNNNTNYKAKAPTNPDILAILPIKTSTGVPTGSLLVEFSGSLQDNTRTYFGPVNIERMRIKLVDDKGNVLNLNGMDWCVTLIAECLYQY